MELQLINDYICNKYKTFIEANEYGMPALTAGTNAF
jgi:hypothetical protein